jgi:hypothetical protein
LHLSGPAPIPPSSDEEEDGDRQMDADELRDFLEQDILPPNVHQLLDHMQVPCQHASLDELTDAALLLFLLPPAG